MGLIIIFGIIEVGILSHEESPSHPNNDLQQLSISAWLTSRFNSHHNFFNTSERDRTRFLLFTSIWTVVFSAVYTMLFFHSPDGSFLTSVGSHGILCVPRSLPKCCD